MDALKVLKERRSVRKYDSKPVDKKLLEEIVECGSQAATAKNVQPWKFVIITEEKTRQKLKSIIPNGPFIDEAPAVIAVFCEDTKYFLEDGCAATQNILLAAKALGLGSCWVAGYKKDYMDDVKNILNVPEHYNLISLVTIGYAVKESQPVKKSKDEIFCYEKFDF